MSEDAAIHNVRLLLRVHKGEQVSPTDYIYAPARRAVDDAVRFSASDVAFLLSEYDKLKAADLNSSEQK